MPGHGPQHTEDVFGCGIEQAAEVVVGVLHRDAEQPTSAGKSEVFAVKSTEGAADTAAAA